MNIKVLVLLTTLLFSTSVFALQEPNWESGEGCAEYNVLEVGNTGRLTDTHPLDIPVYPMKFKDLERVCGVSSWACFLPLNKSIYIYRFEGKRVLFEERCHGRLGALGADGVSHLNISSDLARDWEEE